MFKKCGHSETANQVYTESVTAGIVRLENNTNNEAEEYILLLSKEEKELYEQIKARNLTLAAEILERVLEFDKGQKILAKNNLPEMVIVHKDTGTLKQLKTFYETQISRDTCDSRTVTLASNRNKLNLSIEALNNVDQLLDIEQRTKEKLKIRVENELPIMTGTTQDKYSPVFQNFLKTLQEIEPDEDNVNNRYRLLLLNMELLFKTTYDNFIATNRNHNYAQARDRLLQCLNYPEAVHSALSKLWSIRRHPGETLLEYAMRIAETAQKLRPYLELTCEGFECLMVFLFQRALPDAILEMMNKTPNFKLAGQEKEAANEGVVSGKAREVDINSATEVDSNTDNVEQDEELQKSDENVGDEDFWGRTSLSPDPLEPRGEPSESPDV